MTYHQSAGLFVPVVDAGMVAAALRRLRAELRRDGQTPPPRLLVLLADAEALAAGVPQERAVDPEPTEWIPSEVAAEMLGLSVRYTRGLPGIRRRKAGRIVLLALVDVEEEAEARRAAAAGFRKITKAA